MNRDEFYEIRAKKKSDNLQTSEVLVEINIMHQGGQADTGTDTAIPHLFPFTFLRHSQQSLLKNKHFTISAA